jgi:hypothetical protein
LTAVRGADREHAIEWRTYTPDGRVLTVRRAGSGWVAACGGREAARESLVDALREAVVGEAVPLRRDESLESWIRETAAHILGDTIH